MGGSCTFTMSRNIRRIVVVVSSSGEQVFKGVGRDFGFWGGFDGIRAAEIWYCLYLKLKKSMTWHMFIGGCKTYVL